MSNTVVFHGKNSRFFFRILSQSASSAYVEYLGEPPSSNNVEVCFSFLWNCNVALLGKSEWKQQPFTEINRVSTVIVVGWFSDQDLLEKGYARKQKSQGFFFRLSDQSMVDHKLARPDKLPLCILIFVYGTVSYVMVLLEAWVGPEKID